MIRRRHLGPVAALVTLAVLGGSGAAVASWTAAASVSATASSASAATTLTQAGSLTTTYAYAGTSSSPVGGTLVLTNTGTTPLTYTLTTQLATGSSSALAQKTTLSLWTGTCGAAAPATGAVTTTLANPMPALPAAAQNLAAGTSVTVCVATKIAGTDAGSSNAALQGQSVTATFTATGAVGANWKATSTAAPLTQSVYRLAPATAITCTNGSAGKVTLSWAAPANRPSGSVTYRVFDTVSGREIDSVTANSLTIKPFDISPNGTFELAVEAKESSYSTTATVSDSVTVIRTSPLDWGILPRLQCAS
ncbi:MULTISPECIES: hypothetical protein [Microbacterium]|uniref:Fibronectin type-III domain-containing protein n=1 Tax=Microbacterium saccharophilum TaxID=1213358 RepID=A0A7Z7CZQ8_9MICO|nr:MULTISPECIES: hypothetical protein [Microbacterium]SFI50088.1 hypothetical protein SAMN04487751_1943 [Microbacterium saccharophilum]